jgi:MFS family permease
MPNPNSWTTKLTLLLASSLTVMSGATVAPSLPAMKQQFESAIADPDLRTTLVKLVITLPALFIVIGSPIAGLIVDRFGRKPLLLITAVLYGFAGSSGLFLDSLPTILVGRAFLGLAVAGVMVSATTLIADYYSGPARAAFMGLQSGFMGLGGVLFLTLGGALAQQNWHYPFGIYLFAWLIVPLIFLFIESIPLIGQTLRQILLGGESIGTITLQHLFTIHSYLLSAVALGLSTIHLVSSLLQSQPEEELPLDPRIIDPVQNPR